MKKISAAIIFIMILCSTLIFGAELPSHPNFTVIEKVKYDPWGDGFIHFFENDKMGVQDLDGNIVIAPEWDMVYWSHNDEYRQTHVAGVQKDGLWGIIDKQGNVLWEPVWKDALINKDTIRVLDTNNKYGYLDGYGNILIEPKYDFADSAFYNGIVLVGRDFGYTYIDRQGNELMPLQPERMYADHHLGEYFYYNKDGKGFILDRNGNIISDGKYNEVSMYHKDCIIAKQNDKQGVININDEIIIPFEYDRIDYFHNLDDITAGTFFAVKGEKSGYFTEKGNLIGNFEWDNPYMFMGVGDLLLIRKNSKYGLMSTDGTIISEPCFEDVYSVTGEHYIVQKNGLVGVLNSDGTYLVEPRWATTSVSSIRELENDYFELHANNFKYGLLDKSGNLIIEPMFDSLKLKDGKWIAGIDEDWYSIKLADNPEIRNDDMLTRKEPTPEADFLIEKGVLKGDESGDLMLWDTVTRAEFVSMLGRVENWENEQGNIPFEDVQNHWAEGDITAAVNRGLIKGYDEKTFAPDGFITYSQAMLIILRAMGFTDDYIENYPAGGIGSLASDAKIKPQGMSYSSNNSATREAVAKMLYQYIHTDMTVEKVKALPPKAIEYMSV